MVFRLSTSHTETANQAATGSTAASTDPVSRYAARGPRIIAPTPSRALIGNGTAPMCIGRNASPNTAAPAASRVIRATNSQSTTVPTAAGPPLAGPPPASTGFSPDVPLSAAMVVSAATPGGFSGAPGSAAAP